MPTCFHCKTDKPKDEFYRNRFKKSGYQHDCKECHKRLVRERYYANLTEARKYHQENQQKRKEATLMRILDYLREHPCVDCGESDPVCLEFDHVRGRKVNTVCALALKAYSWRRVKAEMRKCAVRCANCHRRKTHRERGHLRYLLSIKTTNPPPSRTGAAMAPRPRHDY